MFRKACIAVSAGLVFSLSGCGGGGSNNSTANVNSYKQIVGDWITGCENYQLGKSRIRSVSYPEKKDDNSQAFLLVTALFNSSNCSGTSSIVGFGGPIDYRGKHTTSICIAEKTDINLIYGLIDDVEITGSNLQQLFLNAGLVNPSSNIACKYNDQLLTGLFTSTLNGSSDSTRPIEMDTSATFSHWDRTSSARARKTKESNLKAIYSDFLRTIK